MAPFAPPFGITVCGIDELAGHGTTGATHVLSILDPEHPVPEAFGTFGEHRKLELRFDDSIEDEPGKRPPTAADVEQILAFGRDLMAESGQERHLLVHCHVGISRSTAAMVLILAQAMPDETAGSIVGAVHAMRDKAWPNLRIIEMGDAMLQRGGSLVAATNALHAWQLRRRPELGSFFQEVGRGREITGAAASSPPVA